jgi:hypothetical protein
MYCPRANLTELKMSVYRIVRQTPVKTESETEQTIILFQKLLCEAQALPLSSIEFLMSYAHG